MILARTRYKRPIRLSSWNRAAIPLLLNVIYYRLPGPYHVPEDAHTEEARVGADGSDQAASERGPGALGSRPVVIQ